YPRGDLFLVELPGTVKVAAGEKLAFSEEDLSLHLRRGEAVRLGATWYRVSSEVT
ncbi:unnamed protein product, partial [Discosporangium mesarthrocarpum]